MFVRRGSHMHVVPSRLTPVVPATHTHRYEDNCAQLGVQALEPSMPSSSNNTLSVAVGQPAQLQQPQSCAGYVPVAVRQHATKPLDMCLRLAQDERAETEQQQERQPVLASGMQPPKPRQLSPQQEQQQQPHQLQLSLPQESLYERIGGAPVLEATIEELHTRVMRDTLLAPYFTRANMAKLHAKQVGPYTWLAQ